MENEKKISGKIGCELEFWHTKCIDDDTLAEFDIINEYYSGMFELNNFLQNWESEKDIYDFLTNVVTVANNIAKKLKQRTNGNTMLHTKGISIDSRSMVFNGLHIHVSLTDYIEQLALFNRVTDNNVITNWKLENYPSLRSIVSHHIWGSMRSYQYDYKQKRKFVPVLWTGLDTIEIRIFDNEDILIKSRRKKLAKFLFAIFTNRYVNKYSPRISKFVADGENLADIFDVISSFNAKNNHYVKKFTDFAIIKNKCNEVIVNFEENYLEVRR